MFERIRGCVKRLGPGVFAPSFPAAWIAAAAVLFRARGRPADVDRHRRLSREAGASSWSVLPRRIAVDTVPVT